MKVTSSLKIFQQGLYNPNLDTSNMEVGPVQDPAQIMAPLTESFGTVI